MKKNNLNIALIALLVALTACSPKATQTEQNNTEKLPTNKSLSSKENANTTNNKYKATNLNSEDIVFVSLAQNSYVSDPKVPQNLINQSAAVVKAVVLEKQDTSFLGGSNSLFTKYRINVTEVMQGSYTLGENNIYSEGGIISVAKFKEYKPDSFRKLKLDSIPEGQRKNKYISFESEDGFDLEIGTEYVLLISDKNIIMCSGYGTFKQTNANSDVSKTQAIYKNVLTETEFPSLKR